MTGHSEESVPERSRTAPRTSPACILTSPSRSAPDSDFTFLDGTLNQVVTAAAIVALVDAAVTITAAAFAAAAPGAASLAAATINLALAAVALAAAVFASAAPAITALVATALAAAALAVAALAGSNGSCADGTPLPGIPGSYYRVAHPDGTFGLERASGWATRVIELGSALRARHARAAPSRVKRTDFIY